MDHFHAVVWVDHSEARVIEFGIGGVVSKLIRSTIHPEHIDFKAASFRAGHAHEDRSYLTAVAEALQTASAILIVGPSGARKTLAHFIHDQVPSLASRIIGVEPLGHRSEPEIVDFARKYFERSDLMMAAQ
jgi:stalled ribosome rescue protein Dom34